MKGKFYIQYGVTLHHFLHYHPSCKPILTYPNLHKTFSGSLWYCGWWQHKSVNHRNPPTTVYHQLSQCTPPTAIHVLQKNCPTRHTSRYPGALILQWMFYEQTRGEIPLALNSPPVALGISPLVLMPFWAYSAKIMN